MDDQNQTAPTDAPADSGTGTIFNPGSADATPYEMTQSPANPPAIGTPPPVFAQPAAPAEDIKPAPSLDNPTPPKPAPEPEPSEPTTTAGTSQTTSTAGESDLMAIKKDALQSLTPLVDDLELKPEDKFKTMMMLIQASDNSSLIKKAYDAANAIQDEKERAQALLDVVNEINYFTQNKKPEA